MADVGPPPGDWTHAAGHRLNHDGAQIRYTHPSGLEAVVEAMPDPDPTEDRLQLRPTVFTAARERLEYPPIYYDAAAALACLHGWMGAYPQDAATG